MDSMIMRTACVMGLSFLGLMTLGAIAAFASLGLRRLFRTERDISEQSDILR